MKNALFKDTVREIKHSFGRFLSIFLIIVLGSGFFAGIKATMPDMLDMARDYFSDNKLMDYKLQSTIGVKSDEIEAVKNAPHVSGIMAGYSKDVFYHYDNQNLVLKFMSFNDSEKRSSKYCLNNPVVVEGRLPQKAGECAVELKMTSPNSFKIGNSIKIAEPDSSKKLSDSLTDGTYKIVGIVTSPLYIGYERDATTVGNGTVVSNVYVPESNFVADYYTELYVRYDNTSEFDPFSDEYKKTVSENSKETVKLFENSVNKRYDKLISDAQAQINKNEGSALELEKLLSCTKLQLAALMKQTTTEVSALKKVSDSYNDDNSAAAVGAKAKYNSANEKLEMIAALNNDGKDNAVRNKYQEQLENANAQIKSAKAKLASQKKPSFYEYDRFDASVDYSSFYGDAQKIDSIAKVFPVFFILVAALVCLTTMTRMVEEQRIQIGTYKALGYSSAKIAGKYLIYGIVAAVFGSCIGVALGLQIFPKIIYSCYKMMYNIPKITAHFKLDYMLWCCLVSVVCTCAAVLFACIMELRSQPSQLMRPKPPKQGKRVLLERITPIWSRLDFLTKVTIRNLLRYKKRFFMTVIGVAGCTALIITGFGLKYSIKSIVDKQYNEIINYDGVVVLNTATYSENKLDEKLSEFSQLDKHMLVSSTDGVAKKSNSKQNVSVLVPSEPDKIEDYVHLRDKDNDEKLSIKNGEAVITEKLAKLLELSVGDKINVKLSRFKAVDIKISGISKNYALHYVYISPQTYEQLFGEKPTYNLSFVNFASGINSSDFKEQLIKNSEFYGMTLKSDNGKSFMHSVDSLNAIVILLIVCAGGLAFVVVYNLANINITERVREIATIKVLGFYDKETSDYINRENIISSVIGIIVGSFAGMVLHYFVVITSEVDLVLFNHQLVWWAYLYGALLTMGFTLIVNLVLHYKLKNIDMVESLKSVE